jgi:hypothetical protein
MIVKVRFDMVVSTADMIRLNKWPRKIHLKVVKRILFFLKNFPTAKVIIDTS